jgi:uncharacterized protein involved in exopolysaccharide biosynthesis
MGPLSSRGGLPLLSDHTDFLRRHRAPLVGLMTAGLLAGYAWSLHQPDTYSATASIALAPVPVYVMTSTDELVPPEVTIDTDAQLLQSREVLDAIGDVLGADRETAAGHLSVTASANTRVLHVKVTAHSAEDAAAAANAAVTALADVRRHSLGALQESQIRNIRRLAGTDSDELQQVADQDVLVSTDDEQLSQVLSARASLDELEEARANPTEVVGPAVPPAHADYANTEVPLVSGAMLGLLAGCLVGIARDRRTSRTHPVVPTDSRVHPAQIVMDQEANHA